MSFPTPRRPPARTRDDGLDGEEVLEITLFAEKKAWIDDKIDLLSTRLPRIVVHDPLPPLASSATNQELEEWWKEHEAIETEVHEYDYGDLTKMRTFAKQKSKQQLSARDTDLIEVCLTTIFALDKLLSLLRQRRKSLVLLGYRLQWEDSLESVWRSHRRLLDDEIPAFLSKSRFSVSTSTVLDQSDAVTASNLLEPEAESMSKSLSASSLLSDSSSGSVARRRRLSSLSVHSHSRALRHQTLLLSLSSLKSHLHQLFSSELPSTSNVLDKLIDHSPEPIPDAFLDEQDKVEDTVRADFGVKGGDVSRWLDTRIDEWSACDDVLSRTSEGEKEAEMLEDEVDAEMGKLRIDHTQAEAEARNEWVVKFQERLNNLEESLGHGHDRLEHVERSTATAKVPSSIHRRFPDFVIESRRVLDDLAERSRRAQTAADSASRQVDRFRKGVAIVSNAGHVRVRLADALRTIQNFLRDRERMTPPPSAGWEDSESFPVDEEIEDSQEEKQFQLHFDSLVSSLDSLGDVKKLVKEGIGIVAHLGEVGIDPNSRRELKQLVEGLEDARIEVERIKIAEDGRRTRVAALRRMTRDLDEGRRKFEETKRLLSEQAKEVRWVKGKRVDPELDMNIFASIEDVRERCADSHQAATRVLESSPRTVSHLSERLDSLNRDLDSLTSLKDVIERTCAQSVAIEAFELELEPIRTELDAISHEAIQSRSSTSVDHNDLSSAHERLDKRLSVVLTRLAPLTSDVHLRIPFLSSTQGPHGPTPGASFDLVAHENSIRLHLNTLVARISQQREESTRQVERISAIASVVAWDNDRQEVEEQSTQLTGEIESLDSAIVQAVDADQELMIDVETSYERTSTALVNLAGPLSNLSDALDLLLPTLELCPLPPHLELDRKQAMVLLQHQSSECLKRVDRAKEELTRIKTRREDRIENWRLRQGQISSALEKQREEIESVHKDCEDFLERLDVTALGESVDSQAALDRAQSTLYGTTSAVASLLLRLRKIEVDVATVSDDLDALATTVPPSDSFANEMSSAEAELQAVQSTQRAAEARAHSLQDTLDSYRLQLAVFEAKRAEQHRAREEQSAERRRKEEEETMKMRFAERLVLAKSIALPQEEKRVIADESVADPWPTSPNLRAPSIIDDVFGLVPSEDPFAVVVGAEEPVEISNVRAKVELLHVRDWLDSQAILRLPTVEESNELRASLGDIKRSFESLEKNDCPGDGFASLQGLVSTKEEEVDRVSRLANFSLRVKAADTALSNLLDSIDAASPGLPSSPPLTLVPLSEAINQASDAVTSVRHAAIPLVDDARVEQAVGRIEESWMEMMLMVEEVRPRSISAASSTASLRSNKTTSSLRLSTRVPSRQPESTAMSRSSSSSTSTASLALSRSRHSSRSSLRSPSLHGSLSRSSSHASIADRLASREDPLATPRRRNGSSGLPLPTPRRNPAPVLPPMTPTTARPFSFSTSSKMRPPSGTPVQIPSSTPRKPLERPSRLPSTSRYDREEGSSMSRSFSSSSRASSHRESLASSTSSRRSSAVSSIYRRPSLSPENLSRIGYRSSPPRHDRPRYRANLSNKLDREVGSIVNALDIHVPIEMADGSWSDESGMYKIGDKVYFCRILRSKNVMVRVGGGWLNLLQFIITHFAPSEKINISPTTPVKRTLGNEPQWISSHAVREQLKPTPMPSYASLRSPLASSVSSHGSHSSRDEAHSSLSASISSSMRRSISSSSAVSTPLRRSVVSEHAVLSPTLASTGTPRQQSRRPAIPIWRP